MSSIIRYAVVSAAGKLARHSFYDTIGKAKNWCRHDGDAVVEVEISLDREPLFIRSKTL